MAEEANQKPVIKTRDVQWNNWRSVKGVVNAIDPKSISDLDTKFVKCRKIIILQSLLMWPVFLRPPVSLCIQNLAKFKSQTDIPN